MHMVVKIVDQRAAEVPEHEEYNCDHNVFQHAEKLRKNFSAVTKILTASYSLLGDQSVSAMKVESMWSTNLPFSSDLALTACHSGSS